MTKLTNNQKKFLRTLAHALKPVVTVGKHGLTPAVLTEIENSLQCHELLKIKIRFEDKVAKQAMLEQIVQASCATLVQIIGSSLTIYRAFAEDAQIMLPKK